MRRLNISVGLILGLLWGSSHAQEGLQFTVPKALGPGVNTEVAELHPVFNRDTSQLYFVRMGHPDNQGDAYDQDIWVADRFEDDWGEARNVTSLNNERNNDLFGFTLDGQTAYLFNSYTKGKKAHKRGVALAENKGKRWERRPDILDIANFGIEGDHFSFFITADEQLILLSHAGPGNMGQEDLYVTLRNPDGTWPEPMHLGATLNTSGFEISPFLTSGKDTLFFASNGHGGQGDADIFYSVRQDDTWQSWSEPVNLGPIVNSDKFDAYFILDGSKAWFSSNRDKDSLWDLDIYRMNRILPEPPLDSLDEKDLAMLPSMDDSLSKPELELDDLKWPPDPDVEEYAIYFDMNSSKLTEGSQAVLDHLIELYGEDGFDILTIESHTDKTGSSEYNMRLSEKRMGSVQAYLESGGLEGGSIYGAHFGEGDPVYDCEDCEDNLQGENRRTVIRVKKTATQDDWAALNDHPEYKLLAGEGPGDDVLSNQDEILASSDDNQDGSQNSQEDILATTDGSSENGTSTNGQDSQDDSEMSSSDGSQQSQEDVLATTDGTNENGSSTDGQESQDANDTGESSSQHRTENSSSDDNQQTQEDVLATTDGSTENDSTNDGQGSENSSSNEGGDSENGTEVSSSGNNDPNQDILTSTDGSTTDSIADVHPLIHSSTDSLVLAMDQKHEYIDGEEYVIYFDLDSYSLNPRNIEVLDEVLRRYNGEQYDIMTIESHCDLRASNSYNMTLSENRMKRVRSYLTGGGLVSNSMYGAYFGEEIPVNDCLECEEELHTQNRRTVIRISRKASEQDWAVVKSENYHLIEEEKEPFRPNHKETWAAVPAPSGNKREFIIYYDFDSDVLNEENKQTLNEALAYAQEVNYSSIFVESNCDLRGSISYNRDLSKRRMNSTKGFFVQAGLNGSTLKGSYFGEEKPLHNCLDCEETEHRENRRTVISVYTESDAAEFAGTASMQSADNQEHEHSSSQPQSNDKGTGSPSRFPANSTPATPTAGIRKL